MAKKVKVSELRKKALGLGIKDHETMTAKELLAEIKKVEEPGTQTTPPEDQAPQVMPEETSPIKVSADPYGPDHLVAVVGCLMQPRLEEHAEKVPGFRDHEPSRLLQLATYNMNSVEPYLSTGQMEKALKQAGDAFNYLAAYIVTMGLA